MIFSVRPLRSPTFEHTSGARKVGPAVLNNLRRSLTVAFLRKTYDIKLPSSGRLVYGEPEWNDDQARMVKSAHFEFEVTFGRKKNPGEIVKTLRISSDDCSLLFPNEITIRAESEKIDADERAEVSRINRLPERMELENLAYNALLRQILIRAGENPEAR